MANSVERKQHGTSVELKLHQSEHSPSWQVIEEGMAQMRVRCPGLNLDFVEVTVWEWSKKTNRSRESSITLDRDQAIALRDALNLQYPV